VERRYDGRAVADMTTIMSAGVSVSALTIIHTMILEPEFPVMLLSTRNQEPIEEGTS
jgi:hypothetical protein